MNALALSRELISTVQCRIQPRGNFLSCYGFERIHCFEGLVVSKETLSWARKVKGGGFSMDSFFNLYHRFDISESCVYGRVWIPPALIAFHLFI